ncbi:MAG: secreted protein [Fibrobacteres bacterium]|nr:secreted protein [Fibrobacterota bacterium]
MRHLFLAITLSAALRAFAAPVVEGDVDPVKLLAWVKAQKAVSANVKLTASKGFCMKCSDENSKYTGEPSTVPLYQVGTTSTGASFFEADMDVDCDGSKSGPCNVSLDPSHQPELSCGCNADAGKLPFFVLPLGSRFNASSRGIELGAVAACIYKDPKTGAIGLMYGPWLDEDGVSQEIGESSAYMAQQLGVDPNPETGGSDTGNTYIVFPGSAAKLTGNDRLDHAKAVAAGMAAAKKLLADFPAGTTSLAPIASITSKSDASAPYLLQRGKVRLRAKGQSVVSIFSLNGSLLRIGIPAAR